MKKLLSVWLVALICCSLFVLPAMANDSNVDTYSDDTLQTITLSEDYTQLYLGGELYYAVEGELYDMMIDEDGDYCGMEYFSLSVSQMQELHDVYIHTWERGVMAALTYSTNSGVTYNKYYVAQTYLEDYNQILQGNVNRVVIEMYGTYDELVYTDMDALEGDAITISSEEYWGWDTFPVLATNDDANLFYEIGWMFVDPSDDAYYFAPALQSPNNVPLDNAYYFDYDLSVIRVTDETLLERLATQYRAYNSLGLIEFENEKTGEYLAKAVILFIFGLLPLVLLVVSVVVMVKGRGIYRKGFGVLLVCCIAELALFIPLFIYTLH